MAKSDSYSTVDTVADFGDDPEALYKRWDAEIAAAMKDEGDFERQARRIEERYLDEREDTSDTPRYKRKNILWSNTEIMKAALFAMVPKPIIERRYRDEDPVGRSAAQVLDRSITYLMDQSDFEPAIRNAVLDACLAGRGTLRLRYDPTFEQQIGQDGQPFQAVADETIAVDHVHWSDFLCSPARIWEQVRWVAFRAMMTRDQGIKAFGEQFKDVPLTKNGLGEDQKNKPGEDNELFNRAQIYEIWDMVSKSVIWLAKDYDQGVLKQAPDPLGLKNFFPCPKPLTFVGTASNVIPRAEYEMYRDQADQIDMLTQRINQLIDAVSVKGVYDASNLELQTFLSKRENTMTGIKGWQAFAQGGGMKGAIDWLPLEQMLQGITTLSEARDKLTQDLYEVTGIGDIIRGATDPNETATAQRIKGKFASIRLQDKQQRTAEFIRDTIEIMTQIVRMHFSVDSWKKITNLKLPDAPVSPIMPQIGALRAAE